MGQVGVGHKVISFKLKPQNSNGVREVVKTNTLEQDPPNHKIVGGVLA